MTRSRSKDNRASSAVWVAVDKVQLPEKKYFKIGEVAHLVGVEPHVLRYWQTQFSQVRPHKSRSGHRLYRRKDVETLLAIRELLHVQRFTIAGAKQALKGVQVHSGRPKGVADSVGAKPADADTLVPRAIDDTLESPAPDQSQAPSEPAGVPVDVHGLPDSQLPRALDAQLAGQAGAPEVEVEVEADAAPVERAPASASSLGAALGGGRLSAEGDREQLGFGFVSPDRDSVLSARAEVLAMLDVLDRADAAARRRATS